MSNNKKVYVYNMVCGDMSEKLIEMASPATTDFFVHKKLMQAGYTECMWLDESEYIFPTGTDMNEISSLYEPGDTYEAFEPKLKDLGYEIEDITLDSSILE